MAKTLLLIISEPAIYEPLGQFLSEMTYKVKICPNPKDAIDITLQVNPDLVLCYDKLPTVSGNELARLFKAHEKLSEVPFILLSASLPSEEEMEQAGLRTFADDILHMPLDQAEFYGLITRWTEDDEHPTSISERIAGPLSQKDSADAEAEPSKVAATGTKPWNKGKVTTTSIGRLLTNIAIKGTDGMLRLRGERKRLKAMFRNGRLIEVNSNYIQGDSLGRYLQNTGTISQREHTLSLSKARADGIQQGQMLVRMGLLTEQELFRAVTKQKQKKFLQLFTGSWSDAAFSFVETKIKPDDIGMSPVSIFDLLKEGYFDYAKPGDLYNTFVRTNKHQRRLQPTDSFNQVLAQLNLEPHNQDLLSFLRDQTIEGIKMNVPAEEFNLCVRLAFLFAITKGMRFSKNKEIPVRAEQPPTEIHIPIPPEASRTDADAYRSYLRKGQTAFQQNKWQEARTNLLLAIDENPGSSHAMALLAWSKLQLGGKPQIQLNLEAKEMLKKAISLDDTNDTAYLFLGKILRSEGKNSLAISHLKRALELNPANDEVRNEARRMGIRFK